MGQGDHGRITLVETVADVAALPFNRDDDLAFLTQTTLSVDDTAEIVAALRTRFPCISGPKAEDISYATSNRQDWGKEIAPQSELVQVVRAPNSSTSLRLGDMDERVGTPATVVHVEMGSTSDCPTSWRPEGRTCR